MPKCPSCNKNIGIKETFFGNVYKKGCPKCGVHLRAVRTRNAVIGGVGGGTGTFVFTKLFKEPTSFKNIVHFCIWFVLLFFFAYLFGKYEISEENKAPLKDSNN